MTEIVLSGLISDGLKVLLARRRDGRWDLPGGVLRDDDETAESGLARVLEDSFGLIAETQEFLETYYEPQEGSQRPLVHNVSLVEVWSGEAGVAQQGEFEEVRWLPVDDVADLDLSETAASALRDGLGLRTVEPPLPGAPVVFLTGPSAAGKSSVALALCERLPRSAHIEADRIRHMIISGYASPVPEASDPIAAARQADLQLLNVTALARNFSLAGFQTVIDLVLETPEELDRYLDAFTGLAPVYLVTLLPRAETLRQRDEGRPPSQRQGARSQELHRLLRNNGEQRGLRLDSSDLSVTETVARILDSFEAARVL